MLLSISRWKAVVPLGLIGLALLLASSYLVGRDLMEARRDAESEIVALAESSAAAMQFVPPDRSELFLDDLLKHPAIATATVYSAGGARTTRARPSQTPPPLIASIFPSLAEPLVGCREIGGRTFCVGADLSYYQDQVASLVVPHMALLATSAILLVIGMILARGSAGTELQDLAVVVRGAAEGNDYSLRAREGRGRLGEVSIAVNKLLEQMQQRDLMLRRRTTEVEAANRELEAFSYSVSHDLRSPLASVRGFSQALHDDYGDKLDEAGKEYLSWIESSVEQMNDLVTGLLQMSRITRAEIERTPVDLSAMARGIADGLLQRDAQRSVSFVIAPGLAAVADERLVHAVLENLMSNAYKFTRKTDDATITIGIDVEKDRSAFFVRDNGAGFDSTQAARMFTPFQRLHSASEFEGTGVGLSTVKRIVEKHGGSIWADGQPGKGAVFHFTLGENASPAPRAELAGVNHG